jgi:hypothetical protein
MENENENNNPQTGSAPKETTEQRNARLPNVFSMYVQDIEKANARRQISDSNLIPCLEKVAIRLIELQNVELELRLLQQRFNWIIDKTMACDYGDNDQDVVGWHIRHCKGPNWIEGQSINRAIDHQIMLDLEALRNSK